jgi:hypothetical protein
MALLLPTFEGRKCLDLSACAFVVPEEVGQVVVPKPVEGPLIARYERAGREIFLGLILPFPGKKMHVHLTVAVTERFTKEKPKPNCELEMLLSLLEPFLGRKVEVNLKGFFPVNKAVLQPFISATTLSVSDDVQVRMTGASFAVRGAPIQSIAWELAGKGIVNVTLEGKTKMEFDGSYLDQGMDFLENAVNAFSVRKSDDE